MDIQAQAQILEIDLDNRSVAQADESTKRFAAVFVSLLSFTPDIGRGSLRAQLGRAHGCSGCFDVGDAQAAGKARSSAG